MSDLNSLLSRWGRTITMWGTDGYAPRTARRLNVINMVSAMAAGTSAFYVPTYLIYDPKGLLAPILFLIVQTGLFAITPLWHRVNDIAAAYHFVLSWMFSLGITTLLVGSDTGVHYYFIPGAAGALLFFGQRRLLQATVFSIIPLLMFIILDRLYPDPASFVVLAPDFVALSWILNMSGGYFITFIILFYAFRAMHKAEDALEREHARSERLLGNLLPESIAQRLKNEPEKIIADDLGQVTILFADIVDFTPRAGRLPPHKLVAFLNEIFTEFDVLAEKHNLEKIKTIGDAYMVAAGMPDPRDNHAQVVAQMALDMKKAVVRLSKTIGEEVDLRIGLHSGRAVAGVIGTRKFFYDVWGDTVNTAARMESQGEPGRIQVTDETKKLLENDFEFEDRGEIEVKGKGILHTWWLTGLKTKT